MKTPVMIVAALMGALALQVAAQVHYGIDTARARLTREPVTLDGRLLETDWSLADSVRFQFPWGERRGLPATARFLWDDSALYVGVRMADYTLTAETTPPSTAFGGDDMFEIHWAPDDSLWEYFYIMEYNINEAIRGRFRKAKARFLPPNDTLNGRNDWYEVWTMEGVTVANTFQGTLSGGAPDTAWTTEIRIPYASVGGWPATAHSEPAGWNPGVPPTDGSVWRLNLERQEVRTVGDSEWDWSIWNHDSSYPYGTGFGGVHLHDPYNFGAVLFTDPVAVERPSPGTPAPGFSAAPNPFSGAVEFHLPAEPMKVTVHDMMGRVVTSLRPDTRSSVLRWKPVGLPRGVYLARVLTRNGSSAEKKIIIH